MADKKPPTEKKKKSSSLTQRLYTRISLKASELWHTAEGEAWATINKGGDHVPVADRAFQDFIQGIAIQQIGFVVSKPVLEAVSGACASHARLWGKEFEANLRTAKAPDGSWWIDLGSGSYARVDDAGWTIDEGKPPVKFGRTSKMGILDDPEPFDDAPALRHFFNVENTEDYHTLLISMATMLIPGGPFPVLIINGSHGSGKSTMCQQISDLVDPSEAGMRGSMRDPRDLAAVARNHHLAVFDNIGGLSTEMSDVVCRLATGGGFGGRALYTNNDDAGFRACRPVVLNGIPDFVSRGDLISRSVHFHLPALTRQAHVRAEKLAEEFKEVRGKALGLLLNLLVAARNAPEIKAVSRMADFEYRGRPMATVLGWDPDAFTKHFEEKRKMLEETTLEDDAVVEALVAQVGRWANRGREFWQGTAGQLHKMLDRDTSDAILRDRAWPKTPGRVMERLVRAAPALEGLRGIYVDRRKTNGHRMVRISFPTLTDQKMKKLLAERKEAKT